MAFRYTLAQSDILMCIVLMVSFFKFSFQVLLNVYDLLPQNDYMYPVGVGVFHRYIISPPQAKSWF